MAVVVNLLIVVHLLGLVVALGSGIAMIRMRPVVAGANVEQRSSLFAVGKILISNALLGLGILWVTGPLLIWFKHGGVGEFSLWFWLKIIFVIILSASLGIGSKAHRKMREGDVSQAPRVKLSGTINAITGVVIVACAVFAFN